MAHKDPNYNPLSRRDGMILGAIWSFCSVGWIAGLLLIVKLFVSGFSDATFWAGVTLLVGVPVFLFAVLFAIVCELFGISEKQSRRDGIAYFSWALFFNFVIGGIFVAMGLLLGAGSP